MTIVPRGEAVTTQRRSDEGGPVVGQINFGGGVAEKYLGDGRWQRFREDERECAFLRHGMAHEAHEHRYIYKRPDELGGVTVGQTWCDGLAEDAEPYPSVPLLADLAAARAEVEHQEGRVAHWKQRYEFEQRTAAGLLDKLRAERQRADQAEAAIKRVECWCETAESLQQMPTATYMVRAALAGSSQRDGEPEVRP